MGKGIAILQFLVVKYGKIRVLISNNFKMNPEYSIRLLCVWVYYKRVCVCVCVCWPTTQYDFDCARGIQQYRFYQI